MGSSGSAFQACQLAPGTEGGLVEPGMAGSWHSPGEKWEHGEKYWKFWDVTCRSVGENPNDAATIEAETYWFLSLSEHEFEWLLLAVWRLWKDWFEEYCSFQISSVYRVYRTSKHIQNTSQWLTAKHKETCLRTSHRWKFSRPTHGRMEAHYTLQICETTCLISLHKWFGY